MEEKWTPAERSEAFDFSVILQAASELQRCVKREQTRFPAVSILTILANNLAEIYISSYQRPQKSLFLDQSD